MIVLKRLRIPHYQIMMVYLEEQHKNLLNFHNQQTLMNLKVMDLKEYKGHLELGDIWMIYILTLILQFQ